MLQKFSRSEVSGQWSLVKVISSQMHECYNGRGIHFEGVVEAHLFVIKMVNKQKSVKFTHCHSQTRTRTFFVDLSIFICKLVVL